MRFESSSYASHGPGSARAVSESAAERRLQQLETERATLRASQAANMAAFEARVVESASNAERRIMQLESENASLRSEQVARTADPRTPTTGDAPSASTAGLAERIAQLEGENASLRKQAARAAGAAAPSPPSPVAPPVAAPLAPRPAAVAPPTADGLNPVASKVAYQLQTHTKSRGPHPDYPARTWVPHGCVGWQTEWADDDDDGAGRGVYAPKGFTHKVVADQPVWADAADPKAVGGLRDRITCAPHLVASDCLTRGLDHVRAAPGCF